MNKKNDCPLSNCPISQFNQWLDEATQTELNDPSAMALATSTKEGIPSVRMVLLKQADKKGFKFHSNAESQKGNEIASNPYASLCFHWKTLRKQVRIDGKIEIVSTEEADEYYKTRPYNRKIGAWASEQSRPLTSRDVLEERIKEYESQYPEGSDIPRPDYWIGYRVVPSKIEFWMDNPDRLHDRFVYTLNDSEQWDITRLYP